MAVADIHGAPSAGESRFKAAAPVAAGALGIVVAIVGVVSLTGPETPAPIPAPAVVEAPVADNPPAAPQTGSALPGVQFDQAPGAAVNMGMEIVVKFKDDSKVKDIIDAFWKDQGSARTKFDAWKSGRPEFANLKLDRVTYSNELVLVHTGASAADRQLLAMREIAKKLAGVADISYAEPNMTAHPGGQ